MKRAVFSLVVAMLLASFASAEVIINQQPTGIYNLGDVISVPITIKATSSTSGVLDINLICPNYETNFYKNGISLSLGEEKRIESSLILTKGLIGPSLGTCVIKAILNSDSKTTSEFEISNEISIEQKTQISEANPGEEVTIQGTATKKSGKKVNGFIQAEIFLKTNINDSYLVFQETVSNGLFSLDVAFPENIPAGEYILKLDAQEKDTSNEITNQGSIIIPLNILQVPKNLEIIIENPEINPGEKLKGKTILHDQSGENIPATSIVKIKNQKGKIIEIIEVQTNEFFEFQAPLNEPPSELTIEASANKIESASSFLIKEKKDIEIQIVNKTLIITNTGNVPYCEENVVVKIGQQSVDVAPCLEVGGEQKYSLSAPDGEYLIEIITGEERKIAEGVALTGSAIDISEIGNVAGLTRRPFVWIFVIGILAFVATTIFRKGYKRIFIGSMGTKKSLPSLVSTSKLIPMKKGDLFQGAQKAELSLSLKGDKQNVSLICLKIRNINEVKSNAEGVKEVISKIVDIAESKKVVVYENDENIFFIFAPIKTRTFQNEKNALGIANKIKEILSYHNKVFKQKINFGISLNYGAIVAKQTSKILEFMSFGDLMSQAKKVASVSSEEVLLADKMREKFGGSIKTEKLARNNVDFHIVKDMRNNVDGEKFIRKFMERMDKS